MAAFRRAVRTALPQGYFLMRKPRHAGGSGKPSPGSPRSSTHPSRPEHGISAQGLGATRFWELAWLAALASQPLG